MALKFCDLEFDLKRSLKVIAHLMFEKVICDFLSVLIVNVHLTLVISLYFNIVPKFLTAAVTFSFDLQSPKFNGLFLGS
jgi:hypothetical protein